MNTPPNQSIPSSVPAPTHVTELASSCVDFVRRSTGSELDYSPETLPLLDAYLQQVRGEKREEILQLVAPSAGAYLGEVFRKRYGCRWHAPPGEFASWRLEFPECFLYFNPIGMVVETIQCDDTDGLGAALVTFDEATVELREQLENTAPVRFEDYYTTTARFEVVDQVFHFLMIRRDRNAPAYDSEFYRQQVAPDAPGQA